ncbi:hypothetical protein [Luminiphilus syltensis]|uniref:hypothetical protein n=1 Tax=Luminiphilus syltensis TaxID=1341119 RepID=UPI0002D5D538|nr:hypothetical protein [Luminiphilus syltensis]
MTQLDEIAGAILFSDQNKALLAHMLEQALRQPMTPMEPAAAQKYMEQVAVHVAKDEETTIRLLQVVELKSSESRYLMRVALMENDRAIGLDIMDVENGQFFVPESCPVVVLAPMTVN